MRQSGITPNELLPHRGSMLLIDSIVDITDNSVASRSMIRKNNPFLSGGDLHACALIEYMAQTVAILQGWRNLDKGGAIRAGFLVGVDHMVFSKYSARIGEYLDVSITEISAAGDFGCYECSIHLDDVEIGKGIVKVFSAEGRA